MQAGTLFLIPVDLGFFNYESLFPEVNKSLILKINFFVVENLRSARRFLKKVDKSIDIDKLQFLEIEKKRKNDYAKALEYLKNGGDVGVISEAGCTAVADPGSGLVFQAHQQKIAVKPLVGPSSILLALMASGLNGQNFAFNGYLPVNKNERIKALKDLERKSSSIRQSQIFMETPYRNNSILEDALQHLNPSTMLCIAADISLETEFIQTKTIKAWKNKKPDLHKRPAIFIIQN